MSKSFCKQPIDTARLRIRRFAQSDVGPFIQFMTDRESTQFLTFTDEQKSNEGAKALLEATIRSYHSEHPMLAFAVEELKTSAFVGFCGLTPHDQETVEIMYAVMPSARRKGYATEIASTLARDALDGLGYVRVIAPIAPTNKFSKVVVTKAGFRDCGLTTSANTAATVHQFVLEQDPTNNPSSAD